MKLEIRENLKEIPVVSVHLKADSCLLSEKPIVTAKDAIELVADKIYDSAKENAIAIFLEDSALPICMAIVGSGDTANVTFSARDIVQTALLCNASYVTIVHNHPGVISGRKKCEPSKEDILVTNTIMKTCALVGVLLLDSIIVSTYKEKKNSKPKQVYYSIREKGYNRVCKKFGIKNEILPSEKEEVVWELDEDYFTKGGAIPNQQKESSGVEYIYSNNEEMEE